MYTRNDTFGTFQSFLEYQNDYNVPEIILADSR